MTGQVDLNWPGSNTIGVSSYRGPVRGTGKPRQLLFETVDESRRCPIPLPAVGPVMPKFFAPVESSSALLMASCIAVSSIGGRISTIQPLPL